MKPVSKTITHRDVTVRIEVVFDLKVSLKGTNGKTYKPGKATFKTLAISVKADISSLRKDEVSQRIEEIGHVCYLEDLKSRAEQFENGIKTEIDLFLDEGAESKQHKELFELGYK